MIAEDKYKREGFIEIVSKFETSRRVQCQLLTILTSLVIASNFAFGDGFGNNFLASSDFSENRRALEIPNLHPTIFAFQKHRTIKHATISITTASLLTIGQEQFKHSHGFRDHYRDPRLSNSLQFQHQFSNVKFRSDILDAAARRSLHLQLLSQSVGITISHGKDSHNPEYAANWLHPFRSTDGSYDFQGGILSTRIKQDDRFLFGRYHISHAGLATREADLIGFKNSRFSWGLFRVGTHSTTLAKGIRMATATNSFLISFQQIRNHAEEQFQQIGIAIDLPNRDSVLLEFSAGLNPLTTRKDNHIFINWEKKLRLDSENSRLSPATSGQVAGTITGLASPSTILIGLGIVAVAAAVVEPPPTEFLSVGNFTAIDSDTSGGFVSALNTAGRAFSSEAGAAFDVLNKINPTSIAQNLEHGGVIYRLNNGGYAYATPNTGTASSVEITPAFLPADSIITASYHTHAAFDPAFDNENFSNIDFTSDDINGISGYLATPGGAFLYHSTFSTTQIQLGTVAVQ